MASAAAVFGWIFLVLIILGIIVVIILVAVGVIGVSNEKKLLEGQFSVFRAGPNTYWYSEKGLDVALSNDSSISCTDYTWAYQTFTSSDGSISIPNALIWQGDTTKVLVNKGEGNNVQLEKPTSTTNANDANWTFSTQVDNFQRWCLTNKKDVCIAVGPTNNLITKKSVTNPEPFSFEIAKPISGSKCTASS